MLCCEYIRLKYLLQEKNSAEQCLELSAAEYQELFRIIFHQHGDKKNTVICAAHDVSQLLLGKHRKNLSSPFNPSHLTLKTCNIKV